MVYNYAHHNNSETSYEVDFGTCRTLSKVYMNSSFPLPIEDRTIASPKGFSKTIYANKTFMEIYLNPVDQVLKVEYILPNNKQNFLKIYDISGSIIQEQKINSEMGIKHINVSQLVSGVYIIQIGNEKKEFVVK